jgi:rSAM/selenodomain-associated transferase 2
VRISVVIPALDEERDIGAAVESARDPDAEDVEILVVDGGSRDATVERARRAGAAVVSGSRGRARQLEAGFRASSGDTVLFLHADTRLPSGWARAVRSALADPGVAGGAFRFAFRRDAGSEASGAARVLLSFVELGARVRAAVFGLPYGDQALFARRAALDAIGGVPDAPVMEDLDLVRGLRSCGRVVRLGLSAPTSARRYLARGVLRTFWRHAVALGAWRLGVDRERVAAWVRR